MSRPEAPLRIAMISYYLPSGSKIGVGYQVHALANAMIERGHSVTVFSACEESDGALYQTETISIAGSNRTFKFAFISARSIGLRLIFCTLTATTIGFGVGASRVMSEPCTEAA